MTLDQIDDAVRLRNFRKNVMELANVARESFMELTFTGFPHPDSHISLECVRNAVVAECERDRAIYEAELIALGVTLSEAELLAPARIDTPKAG